MWVLVIFAITGHPLATGNPNQPAFISNGVAATQIAGYQSAGQCQAAANQVIAARYDEMAIRPICVQAPAR